MEKSKGRSRRRIKNPFCMPKLKAGNNCSRKTNRLSPMSFLDRFRQAVFRLIMLSAMSKATQQQELRSNYSRDHHHTEAVADCIEFIKRSAIADDGADGHSSEVVFAVPVM
ncbi:unnamed protein product [Withania somnifera]